MKKAFCLVMAIIMVLGLTSVSYAAESYEPDYTIYLTVTEEGIPKAYKANLDITREFPEITNTSIIEELTIGEGVLSGLTWSDINKEWVMDDFSFTTSAHVGVYFYEKYDDNIDDYKTPIKLKIKNSVKIKGADFGIYCSGKLYITGNGNLELENTTDTDFMSYNESSRSCAIFAAGELVITDTNIEAVGTSGGIDGNPIKIHGDAVIKAMGRKSAILSYYDPIEYSDKEIFGNAEYNSFTNMSTTSNISNDQGQESRVIEKYDMVYYFIAVTDTNIVAKSVTMTAKDRYPISIAEDITNGSVSTDKKTGMKDETVVVTAKPANGFVVDKVIYNDGTDHVIIPNGGTYSFAMPASSVTVSATFSKEKDVKEGNDTVEVILGRHDNIKEPDEVNPNTGAETSLISVSVFAAMAVTLSLVTKKK